jgi:DnaK suppressor protein
MNKTIHEDKRENRHEGVRKKLLALRDELVRESNAGIGQILNKEDKYNGVSDDGDIADIACRDSLQAATFARHLAQLRAVEEALLRIAEGTYGICEDCEEEISVGRLQVIPFALRCVECQERHEIASAESEE